LQRDAEKFAVRPNWNRIAGGAEILVHMVQALTHFWNDKVVLKLDISNAYNSVSRTAIMGEQQ
jgi:hypothetical protein